ncbi:MAG: hypothetical protein K2O44_06415 [Clostridia bacterium]|nr:hypothetical protein [Clostridia bacterium]
MLYILTPIFCAGLCLGTVFSFFKTSDGINANAASANGSASVLSIDSSTGTVNSNFENKVQGAQNENVYFGSYNGAPTKWLVLAKNDTKYGQGKNLLLFAEDVFFEGYGQDTQCTSYAFYGTSLARANLVGGHVASLNCEPGDITTSGIEVRYEDSLLNKLFDVNSLSAVQTVDELKCHDAYYFRNAYPVWRTVNSTQGDIYYTNPSTYKTNDSLYNTAAAGAAPVNTKTGVSDANNNFSVSFSASDGVTETLTGDKLFMLDYMDMNNRRYGFVDSNGKTYLEAMFPAVASGYYDGSGDIIEDSYKLGFYGYFDTNTRFEGKGFNANSAKWYWLRGAGLTYNASTMKSALAQVYEGTLAYGVGANERNGYRPAFVLDLSKVVYASSSGNNIFSTLSDVRETNTTTPEYKLYIKDSSFSNTGFKPIITSANNKVKVTFKNSSGKAGNAVLLLQDRNATDGSVAYQAVATMAAGTAEQVVEFTLPSTVTYKDYIPTVMLTSANTTQTNVMATESVYATYTQNGVIIPQDISGMEYNSAHSHWLDNLNLKAVDGVTPKDPVWIDKSTHCDISIVKVKEIKYKSFLTGATEEDKTTDGTSKIINAGEYTITLELADKTKYQWMDGTTTDKPFKITVDRIKPNVTIGYVKTAPAKRYVTDNGGKLPDIQNVHANATPGTLKWHENQNPSTADKYYYWKFEPNAANQVNYLSLTDKNDDTKVEINYNVATVKNLAITINKVKDQSGQDTAVDESIYDAFTLADGDYSLKNYITVKAVYADNDNTTIDIADSDYSLIILSGGSGGKLAAGTVKIQATGNSNNSSVTNKSGTLDNITVLASAVEDITAVYNDNGTHLTYPVTKDDIKGNLTVTAKWNYSGSDYLPVAANDVDVTGTFKAGDPITLTVEYKSKTFDIYPTIEKGTLDMSGVSLSTSTTGVTGSNGAYTFTYDPNVTVEFATSGDVTNAGGDTVAATPTITYKKKNSSNAWVAATAADLQNAGEYQIIAKYVPDDTDNYKIATGEDEITVTLTINKANYPDADKIEFKGNQFYDDGNAHSIAATNVPNGVTVTYSSPSHNGGAAQSAPIDFTVKGKYKVTAHFAFNNAADNANYNAISDKEIELEITNLLLYDMTGVTASGGANASGDITSGFTATYDGSDVEITVSDLPDGVTVDKVVYEKYDGTNWVSVSGKPNGADDYRAVVSFNNANADHATPQDITINLTIAKADVDMSGVKFEDATAAYDGKTHTLTISGTLPDGVTVEYEVKNQSGKEFTEIGTYEFTAKFTVEDTENYNGIGDKTATLTITDASILGITAKVEDGSKFTTVNTLDDLKKALTVTVNTTGGDSVTEDYELTCDNLHDGMFKFGLQKITVKYTDEDGNEYSTFVEISVEKEKVALPTFKGGLSYTGVEVKPKAADFNGYDETLMTFVTDKLQSGTVVGTYKAVFALNDYENYEWATATAVSKKVFAVAVYDGEVTLLANEAAVDWNIAKAVLTATKKDGALPVFASESYIGAFSDIVALKYYKDEACTEEVAAEDLAHETQYFVKAELLDTENFELDASAAQYTVKSFSYTTPAKELTTWEKIVKFLKANWLWIVIAVVALILLITIIALIARAAKKKRERAELAEQRRLEKEEREREERRLEREERMARLSQAQAAPQPQYIPQPMPQMMPQGMPQMGGQSMSMGGGASSNEIAELKAEMAAMKASQDMAKELAIRAEMTAREMALRAEQNAVMRSDINALRGGEQTSGITGITLDKLTELVEKTVIKVLDGRENPAAAATESGASPVAAQVPPDAVMTTVTTTKIDTTKKPAQAAQASAPAPAPRTVVRNFVAPMPVDDGRVFDVGGFYTPADPVTDLGFGDDTDKKD